MCDQTNFPIVTPLRSRDAQSLAEALIKTVSDIIVKHLWDKGQMWPLFLTTAAYAMNTFASEALNGFSPFQLVFVHDHQISQVSLSLR